MSNKRKWTHKPYEVLDFLNETKEALKSQKQGYSADELVRGGWGWRGLEGGRLRTGANPGLGNGKTTPVNL